MRGMRKIKFVFNMGLKPALKHEPPADRRAAQRKTHKCVAQLARDQRSRFTSKNKYIQHLKITFIKYIDKSSAVVYSS